MRGGVTRNALHIDIIFTSWKKGLNNYIPLFQNLPKFLTHKEMAATPKCKCLDVKSYHVR